MKRENNNFDDITVNSLLNEDEDYYKEQYIDCIGIDTITLNLISKPSKCEYIKNRVEQYCSSDAYTSPVINGRISEYTSNNEGCPIASVVLKQLFDPEEQKTYRLRITLVLRVPALIEKQKKNVLYSRMTVDSNGIYNISRLIHDETQAIFADRDNDINNIFESFTINNINMRGSISLKDLPDQDGEKYMKLLSCARRYRYMRDYKYQKSSKSLDMTSNAFTLKFRDGNTILSKMNNKSTYDIQDTKNKVMYCEDKIQVTFSVNKEFFDVRYIRDKIREDGVRPLLRFNVSVFTDVIRRAYDAFINLMIFMYTECDFYNGDIARRFIRESSYQHDTKNILRAYVRRCSNDTEFTENSKLFKQFFKVNYSNAYSNNRKKFVKMGMSTIIIPDILGVEKYKNPLVYMYLSKHPEYK